MPQADASRYLPPEASAPAIELPAGVLRVQTNRYIEAFLIAGLMCALAALLALMIRRNDAEPVLQPAVAQA